MERLTEKHFECINDFYHKFRVLEDMGKTVFLTREEAEKTLKGGAGDA